MMNDLQYHATYRWSLTSLAVLCALLSACRRDPHMSGYIDVINAEKRALEDQIYQLEYDCQRKSEELEKARKEIERLGGRSSAESISPRIERSRDDDNGLDLSPPTVIPGVPDEPRIEIPDLPAPSRGGSSSIIRNDTTPVSNSPALIRPGDPRITQLYVDPRQTGGADFDQQPGDDGVMVVLQPRNAQDEFVPLAGPINVVLLEYAKRDAGEEARIARWDLSAQQVDRVLRNDTDEQGIFLRLAWSDETPRSDRLMVAVRYTTADGRQLEARRDIFVTLPGQFSQRWTPRSLGNGGGDRELNIARQPAVTDGANYARPPGDKPPAQTVRASHGDPVDHSSKPIWRPDR